MPTLPIPSTRLLPGNNARGMRNRVAFSAIIDAAELRLHMAWHAVILLEKWTPPVCRSTLPYLDGNEDCMPLTEQALVCM